jgi:son of sevenless-like protein
MNGPPNNAPQSVMYVRALYDYEADDRTSLSFHEGDVIQVITQLESGWWDGVINGVRGWFPSNYCQVLSNPEDVLEDRHLDDPEDDDDLDAEEEYDDHYGHHDDHGGVEREHDAQLPIEGFGKGDKTRADFWIPQATPDGRLFYYNTMTGESSMELPLESPSSATENGPRDRMNITIPDKTRPPQEMMAHGFIDEEDYESEGNSASELDGESIMMSSTSSLVCPNPFTVCKILTMI